MKPLDTGADSNVFAGTFGGVMLSICSNGFMQDVLRTIILAVVGAVVSFGVSLVLKSLIQRKKH